MFHSHRTKTLPLNHVLSSHPLVVLVGAVVSACAVVAMVMNYLTSERITNLDIKHKAEIEKIEARDKTELLAAKTPLNQKIEDLNFRLASIERRVPGSGPLYLDITTVTKSLDIRRTLSSGRYTSYDNDGFYVAVPPGAWKFEMTNQLSLIKSMYTSWSTGWDLSRLKTLAQVVEKFPVFLWQGSSKANVFSNFFGEKQEFTYRPSIAVEHITSDLLKEEIDAGIVIGDNVTLMMQGIEQKLVEFGTKWNTMIDQLVLEEKLKMNTEEEKVTLQMQAAKSKLSLNEATTKQDRVKVLEELASSGLTDYVLFSEIGKMSSQNVTSPLRNHILSIQHKGNVFYIQNRITFTNVEMSINDGEPHHATTTSVDQEIFFFSKGKDGYLVTTFLPPVPDQAENFVWSNNWLTEFQIPIY